MLISQKCQYALRAVFELARRWGEGPIKIAEIADAQAIPPRFLEVILSQLKQAGFIESRRGSDGGYALARAPASVTVGDVIQFIQGPVGPVACVSGRTRKACPLYGQCVFLPMWEQAKRALAGVYDQTSFQDLLERERQMHESYAATYTI
jgi:Rrf2 family protein